MMVFFKFFFKNTGTQSSPETSTYYMYTNYSMYDRSALECPMGS